MSTATNVRTAERDGRVPWVDVVMSAVAAVSWALIGMAGTAALGLRLLEADAAGSPGPTTAAVVALGAGGSVTPSGDVSASGLSGAETAAALEVTPPGVSLVGALLLSYFFLRSLRTAGAVVCGAELLARAGAVVALFVAMTGGLVRAGHDVVTVDGGPLGLDDLPGTGGGGVELRGRLGTALLLGAVWGAGAGAAGALLARASGAAGVRATPLARGATGLAEGWRPAPAAGCPGGVTAAGPYAPGSPAGPRTRTPIRICGRDGRRGPPGSPGGRRTRYRRRAVPTAPVSRPHPGSARGATTSTRRPR